MALSGEIKISKASLYYGASDKPLGYQVEVWHDGLNEHRVLRDKDLDILESKANAQIRKWVDKWERLLAKEAEQDRRERGKEGAEEATREAETALEECGKLLASTLSVNDAVDWLSLKETKRFVYEPEAPIYIKFTGRHKEPTDYERVELPRQPKITDNGIAPTKGFLDKIIPPLGRKKDEQAARRLEESLDSWEQALAEAEAENARRQQTLEALQRTYAEQKAAHEERQRRANAQIDELRERYQQKDPVAVEEHAELVLNASSYPDWMKVNFQVAYNDDNGMLIVDYDLPDTGYLPTLRKVSYVASRDEITEKHISESQRKKLYDSVIYQIALRTLHELFEADEVDAIAQITFNGWVDSVDRATGQRTRKCIATVQAAREEFLAFDLTHVDPKACFKKLKGVAATSLSELAPVTPIIQFNREDSRFIEARDVVDGISTDTNLAAMSWEDFEHLIREVFQKHFEADGGEVRVTQASRDGGVDAIAFDPDPIRGGKMVIQAKRYTNTVGVSAVRDLYGTVVNEGAVKGILITTSDYGPDAYVFAKDKPLTLLNGSNLLHLLQEHGYKAKIDLQEAKQLAAAGQAELT
ncbi:restriction endonuclease [Halomonas sp.]|uniref:restriction endonuclease n=1 Tax=Halomonas sp. TaxID=1486246 RepID=UPI000C92C2AF|nr:restriction endonuclease [Halomonas sp.]MAR71697.1 restriction endonuclease [Halomonas sp.]MBR9881385.1 restriction endonuclease [Gammaproteobacteria bacterium]